MKMMTLLKRPLVVAISLGLSLGLAHGATLTLKDGSRIEGSLVKIHEDTVYFETGFAGTLEIPQDKVEGITSGEAIVLRTRSGEVFEGPVSADAGGTLSVASNSGIVQTGVAELASGWKPGGKDPIVAAREAELANQVRQWSYLAGVDITGSNGNTDNFGSAIILEALLEGPKDKLLIYGSYRYKENDGVRAEDEQKGGIRYTSFFSEKWGWFIRQELERDTFEGIDFRSTSAAGLTYRFIKQERLSLEGSGGLSYRYESYSDSTQDSDGFPGLDFGLNLDWQFADWGKLVTKVAYIPSIDDFGDYLIEHESGIDVPLGTADNWVMRLGLSNQYNSTPSGGRENMDTTYFARLILKWD
jgi:putative salt-induced outer membrane protein YdiY